MLEHFGWPVTRLIRLSFGPFQLGRLRPGEVEEVTGKVLREQLGATVAGAPAPRRPRSGSHGESRTRRQSDGA